ncbi:unnamed protein product [Schistosoma intercalatum]|nr:unnamed protein product [Schistosoma intercalatum]
MDQRCYSPSPNWYGPKSPNGCEVFIVGLNRGYAFCMYTNRDDTKRAVNELNCYEIRKGKILSVCFSIDNCHLFIGVIPKLKAKDEIMLKV